MNLCNIGQNCFTSIHLIISGCLNFNTHTFHKKRADNNNLSRYIRSHDHHCLQYNPKRECITYRYRGNHIKGKSGIGFYTVRQKATSSESSNEPDKNKFETPEKKNKKGQYCDASLPTTRFSSITERSASTVNEFTPTSQNEKIVFPHPYVLRNHLSPRKPVNEADFLRGEKKNKSLIPLLNLKLTQKNSGDSISQEQIYDGTSNRISGNQRQVSNSNLLKSNNKFQKDWDGVNMLILTASHDRIIQNTKARILQLTLYTKQINSGGDLSQNFHVIEEGSFGKVYKGKYNNSDVAVKVPNLVTMEADPIGVTERILREWKLLAKIKHPNIVGLKGGIILPNRHIWLLTNYINGCDLHSLRYKYNLDIPIEKSFLMVKQLVGVLDFLHTPSREKGIVIHRDIKPENIIVDYANWNIFLCDFGDAEEIGSGNKNKLSGATWLYSPIELLSSDPIGIGHEKQHSFKYDEKWDIWSLGCVIQEFFGYSNPFEYIIDYSDGSEQIYSKLVKAVRENRYYPSIPQNIHPLIKKIITMCLQVNPRLRPTAKKILQILSQLD